jgi:hypothetical protein
MEALFSTVAQICFTIVGFFFVGLTVDAETRVYWLAKKERAQYVSLIFLNMLLPGLFPIGFLIPLSFLSLPAWLYVAAILLVAYLYIQIAWLKAQKALEVRKHVARFESSFDVNGNLKFSITVLVLLIVAGVSNILWGIPSTDLLSFVIGLCLFILILGGVISAYLFLRKNTEVRYQESLLVNAAKIETKNLDNNTDSGKSTGIIYIAAMLVGLFFYLLGLFSKKE